MEKAGKGNRPRKFNTTEKAGERKFEKRRDDAFSKERKSLNSRDSEEKKNRRRDEMPHEERIKRHSYRNHETSSYGAKKARRYDDFDNEKEGWGAERSEKYRSKRRDNEGYSDTSSFDRNKKSRFGKSNDGERSQSVGRYSEKRKNDTRERRFNDATRDERRDFEKTKYYEREERFERKKRGERSERFEHRSENEEIRLNRYIAQSGICSRREADEMIALGEVKVNGKVVTEMGTKVTKNDKVVVNDELIKNEKLVYLVLNKPKGFITSADDPEGRDTVMDLVKHACKERIYPVGRLDRNTTGILLFTNDGDLAKKLTHPSHQVRKVYHVFLDRALSHNDMIQITEGVVLEDGLAKADVIAYVGAGDNKKEVGIELHSGKNRIVRRIFEHLDYKVVKLDRVSFAGITKKDLPRGRWRFLEDREISFLKMV